MATLGALRTGFVTVFVGRVWGRRLWNLCIDEFFPDPSAAPSASLVEPERDLRLYYGKSRNDLWSGSIASSLRMRIFDPGGAMFDRLEAARVAGEGDNKFRARLSSSDGVYKWEGWLRLDTTDRPLSSLTGRQVTEVYAYDGLAEPGNLTLLDGVEASFHATIRNVLAFSLAPLAIQYAMEFSASNVEAGAITPRMCVSPLSGTFSQPAPRLTLGEAFEESIRAMLCRAWQGMNGVWWVAQPWLMGRNLAASGAGAEFFAYQNYDAARSELTEVVESALASRAFQHREGLAGVKARRGIYSLNSQYEIARKTPRVFGSSQYQQNFTFSKWDGDTFRYGSQTGDITFDSRGQFAASMEFGPSAEWENGRQIFDEGSEVYFELNFIWMAERDGGSGDKHFEFEIEARPIESGSSFWLKSDGTWTTTPTTLTTSDETPDPNGSPVLTEHETTVSSIDPFPAKARIYMRWINSNANDRLFLTRHWLRPLTASGDAAEGLEWTTTYRRLDGLGSVKPGDKLVRSSRVINLGKQAATINDGGIDVLNATFGDFEQLAYFLRLSAPSTVFADLTELQSTLILSAETERLREIRGKLVGIHPPEDVPIFDCVPYVWLEGFIDLIPEITDARYAEKPETHDLA